MVHILKILKKKRICEGLPGKVGVPGVGGTDAQGSRHCQGWGRTWPTMANAVKMTSQRRDCRVERSLMVLVGVVSGE